MAFQARARVSDTSWLRATWSGDGLYYMTVSIKSRQSHNSFPGTKLHNWSCPHTTSEPCATRLSKSKPRSRSRERTCPAPSLISTRSTPAHPSTPQLRSTRSLASKHARSHLQVADVPDVDVADDRHDTTRHRVFWQSFLVRTGPGATYGLFTYGYVMPASDFH